MILQWGSELSVGVWYVIYKVLLAIGFVAVVSLQIVYSGLGAKWIVFLTSQGIALLTINYVLDASLVLIRWCWEVCHQDQLCRLTKNQIYHPIQKQEYADCP